tara:strand:- start:275352 stop:277202 length:1851 start_codon:yes stop_codon:yes gene_type:complete
MKLASNICLSFGKPNIFQVIFLQLLYGVFSSNIASATDYCANVSNNGATSYIYLGCPGSWTTGDLINSGTIDSDNLYTSGVFVANGTTINSITNNTGSVISGGDRSTAIYVGGTLTNLLNSGLIQSEVGIPLQRGPGIVNQGTISNLINYSGGTIASTGANYAIFNSGVITSLSNMGTITPNPSLTGIYNTGTLSTLNNSQGSSSSLTFRGSLPANYNIIINSAADYGKISFTNISGTTSFGIHSSSTVTESTTYSDVISGLGTNNIITATKTGIFTSGSNSYSWDLINSSGTLWDLIVGLCTDCGPSAADTQASLRSLASNLRGVFSSQAIATNFANMNTYDCDLFNDSGVCVSVGGQQTYVDNPSSNLTSAVIVAGYRISPQIRIGGFLNQNININTVSSVHISNANPLMGLFTVWNQNEDHLGYQVKVANAYQDKNVKTTRDLFGTSEVGIGSTDLNIQSYVGELSYGLMLNDKTLVRPYIALRHTIIQQAGYTEAANIVSPLTYGTIEDRSLTSLLGTKINHALTSKLSLTGSLGIEHDLEHDVDQLTVTGVSGLTSENFNSNIKRTRAVTTIGAQFSPAKNQRIAGELYYQQLPFQSTASATAYVNYTIGF